MQYLIKLRQGDVIDCCEPPDDCTQADRDAFRSEYAKKIGVPKHYFRLQQNKLGIFIRPADIPYEEANPCRSE